MADMQVVSRYVISLDMGTSSVRACLVDESLHILFQHSISVKLDTGLDGRAEQDAHEIINASLDCLAMLNQWAQARGILPLALSFSNAVASLVILDDQYQPLLPALTWADTRAAVQAQELKERLNTELYQRTACPQHASYWLPKLRWLRETNRMPAAAAYFTTLKDLLIFQLTGKFVMDASNAAATGLRNVRSGDWDDLALREAGISQTRLPLIRSTTERFEILDNFVSQRAALSSKTILVLGATDGVLSSLGAGAFETGQVTSMVGSSAACRVAAETPDTSDEHQRLWSYPLTDSMWVRGGAMTNGGLVTQWFANNFYSDQPNELEKMLADAATIPPGAGGLLFLPYLYGERAPIYDEHARGVFFGLHGSHTRAHVARAAQEGVLFSLASIYQVLSTSIGKVREVRATGGYARSAFLLQLQADIFNFPVSVPANYEGSSIGAAALAFLAIGAYPDFSPVRDAIQIERVFSPNQVDAALYAARLERFKQLYTSLAPLFKQEHAA